MSDINNEFIDHLLLLMSLGEFKPKAGTYFYQRSALIMCTWNKPTRKFLPGYCLFIPTSAAFTVAHLKQGNYLGDQSSILFFNGVGFKDVSAKYARGTICR